MLRRGGQRKFAWAYGKFPLSASSQHYISGGGGGEGGGGSPGEKNVIPYNHS